MMRRAPLARITAVAMLVALSQFPRTPLAEAVVPPPVDSRLLPVAEPPAPVRPTVQRTVCAVMTREPHRSGLPSQLDSLDLAAVWPLSRGAGQRIAVIDTGVSPHRRLPRVTGGGDYASGGDGTQDCDGHGTAIAGIIAAAPDPGIDRFSGVAPDAVVIGIRQSSGKFGPADDAAAVGVGDVDTLAKAVRTAADLGASVINISVVACAPITAGIDDRALGAALAYAVERKNAVVVAAAGDTGNTGTCPAQGTEAGRPEVTVAVSPAWYDEYVLAVGSVDTHGTPSAFTLASPWVDVVAPGESVLSLSPVGDAMADAAGAPGHPEPLLGTGYAAAAVSGLAALIRARFPGWTPREVMERIKATAHHPAGGHNSLVGYGVIDPLAALSTEAPLPTGVATPNTGPVQVGAGKVLDAEPAGRHIAVGGAAILFGVLVAAIALRVLGGLYKVRGRR